MQTDEWRQCLVEFADSCVAERVAVDRLRPELATARADGVISAWWFVRKKPCWRLRYQPTGSRSTASFGDMLDRLTAEGLVTRWTEGIYEPEAVAFGGPEGMGLAHALFAEDSRHILDHLARLDAAERGEPVLGRREAGVLLCSALMRGAGQDWYEQGDVWARVTQHRLVGHGVPASPRLRAAVYRLMTVVPKAPPEAGSPAVEVSWVAAFERAGLRLAELARTGALERGIRAVLAHHVIFHWNRLGLPYEEQAALASLARGAVMEDQDACATATVTGTGATGVTSTASSPAGESTRDTTDRLREALADRLREDGAVVTEAVDAAFRAVPRHLFVPSAPVESAYTDEPIYTKWDPDGVSISAASQPAIVAMMLEQLDARPGHRVLELGAGTGYNAGLLANIVGAAGHVTTVDVDMDIVDGARAALAAAELPNVSVVLDDGALGHRDGAPYDRIIATVGAWAVPMAWLEQLAPHGRLVVPLRLRGSVSRSIAFEHDDGRLRSTSSSMCTFMPLRGIADDARRMVALTPDQSVTLQTNRDQAVEPEALAGVLDQPATEAWSGVLFGAAESFEWLDLWLACTMDNALSRMPVDPSAVESGLVRPQFGWGAMAVVDKASLAYLTLRPAGEAGAEDRRSAERQYEVGAVGHGPAGDEVAGRVVDEIRRWDAGFRSLDVRFEILPAGTAEATDPGRGRFVLDRPQHGLGVCWE